ncbi:MAG: UDP-3-O-(3-hydroxymyristoyl)glucosamine N-acyltransferase [candidate division WOR-3 bacterium]
MRLKEIAKIVKGKLYGKNIEIKNILPPEEADVNSLTFLFDAKMKTAARTVIAQTRIPGKNNIVVPDCKKAMYYLLNKITEKKKQPMIAKTAVIEKGAKISGNCIIESHAIIKKGVRIGKGTYIGAGAFLDENVIIGDYCTIEHNVVIYIKTAIGNYVQVGANSVIGKQGFGYVKFRRFKRLSHIGKVIIKDYVDIGSNVAIDRATIGSTIIGEGTKIDNLVHIAHNVQIGRNCLIMGQAGIAGSTRISDNVVLCGQTGVSDHLKIGKNVIVYAKSAVFSDLEANKRYSGIPAREHYTVLRALSRLYKDL